MAAFDHLSSLADGVSHLLEQHLRLFRLELRADARAVGIRVGVLAALAPLVLVGYGFLCTAAALALREVMAPWAAFALVGGVNLVGAGVGILVAGRQLATRPLLEHTLQELEQTSAAVRAPAPGGGPPA